jgi:predicted nuclease with TOPRIM domain
MKNRQVKSNNSNENKSYKKKKQDDIDFTAYSANVSKSFTDLWQRYSPTAWSEMYNEYAKYTTRMTEIYQEYAKSSERMTELYKELAMIADKMTELYKETAESTEKMSKYWLNYISWMKPLSENKEQREKQE